MDKLIAALVTGAIAVIGALVSLIVTKLNRKKAEEERKEDRAKLDALEAAINSGGHYYVVCPNCGSKILLQGAQIHEEKDEEEKKSA